MTNAFHIAIALITLASLFLVVYHHALYPTLLRYLSRNTTPSAPAPAPLTDDELPSVSLVIPAYNEASSIVDKLFNIGTLDYPHQKLVVHILLDGCTDNTERLIYQTLEHPLFCDIDIQVHAYSVNAGKIACINRIMPIIGTSLTAFSDVSALISTDALRRAAEQFRRADTGVVTGFYRLLKPGSAGESLYWNQQCQQQLAESKLGAIQGAHGAFYVIRSALFQTLPNDTINDDFIIPMQIVASGYKAIMDTEVSALELEQTSAAQESKRRVRIAAGNLQQLIRLRHLLNPRYKAVAVMFASGKCLRVLIPYCLIIALVGSALLAYGSALFALLLAGQVAFYVMGASYMLGLMQSKKLAAISYFICGHFYNFLGSSRYVVDSLRGQHRYSMQRGNDTGLPADQLPPTPAASAKRLFDLTVAATALLIALPIFPLIVLAIKLESRGPAIFSQVRVGRCTPTQTQYFTMYKFRSMVQDAEKGTGATLAKKNDVRVTRVGKFLRKTRLDEIPQLFNVLKGDMSIVGPRPERPDFYGKLEAAIPFFADRTYNVLPGITGLAQVHQGYDTCVEDVRRKVGFDHSYALALHSIKSWFLMDIWIITKTFTVMIMGRGQ